MLQFLTDKSVEELEESQVYLTAKAATELYMIVTAVVAGGKLVITGLVLFKDGICKVGAGGAFSLSPPLGTLSIPDRKSVV